MWFLRNIEPLLGEDGRRNPVVDRVGIKNSTLRPGDCVCRPERPAKAGLFV